MDKYDYVIEKPDIEEVLYHAGFHKYIERWRGKNGKWYYRYKSKVLESATKFANKMVGINDPRSVVNNKKPTEYWFPLLGSSRGRNVVGTDNGKANSRSGQTGSKLKAGLIAGRKRAAAQRSSSVKETQNKRPRSRKKRYTTGVAKVYKH